MLNSLVRLWKSNTRSVPSRGISSGRFTPRVETLDGRVMPAALLAGAVADAGVVVVRGAEESAPLEVVPFGGMSGGVLVPLGGLAGGVVMRGDVGLVPTATSEAPSPSVTRNTGEEIPQ